MQPGSSTSWRWPHLHGAGTHPAHATPHFAKATRYYSPVNRQFLLGYEARKPLAAFLELRSPMHQRSGLIIPATGKGIYHAPATYNPSRDLSAAFLQMYERSHLDAQRPWPASAAQALRQRLLKRFGPPKQATPGGSLAHSSPSQIVQPSYADQSAARNGRFAQISSSLAASRSTAAAGATSSRASVGAGKDPWWLDPPPWWLPPPPEWGSPPPSIYSPFYSPGSMPQNRQPALAGTNHYPAYKPSPPPY